MVLLNEYMVKAMEKQRVTDPPLSKVMPGFIFVLLPINDDHDSCNNKMTWQNRVLTV